MKGTRLGPDLDILMVMDNFDIEYDGFYMDWMGILLYHFTYFITTLLLAMPVYIIFARLLMYTIS